MKKNRMLRLAAILMVVFMGLGMAAQAEEMQLGNDTAGYMTTDLDFYPFISVDIPEETRLQLEKDMGYCQYMCLSDPFSGMIMTMMGYRAEDLGEGTLIDHLNLLLGTALDGLSSLYVEPGHQASMMELNEEIGCAIMGIYEMDEAAAENDIMVVVLYGADGRYAVCYFEGIGSSVEEVAALQTLLASFSFDAK